MQLFVEGELRKRAQMESIKLAKGARQALLIEAKQFSKLRKYDMFL